MMACPVSVMVGVPCVSVMIGVPCVSVMIGVPCVNTICFIYSCAVISTPALVRGDSQAARKVGSSSSARSLTKESTGRLLGMWRKLCDDTGKIPFLGPVNR
ncbi:hypothetical protein OUZ56_018586 [Daphnia magna]|nr:hypothetical protein OUZ56_018586 [Daphnia magna]